MDEQFRRIVIPVLSGFVNKTFKTTFIQQVAVPKYSRPASAAFVEAFCRTCMSVAPFFSSDSELRDLTIAAWKSVCDDNYLTVEEWKCGDQLLVEAANLVYGFLLYPKSWSMLQASVQTKIFEILHIAAEIPPHTNNWYLFKCIVDIFLFKNHQIGSLRNTYRLLNEFETWYAGDGWYKDGPAFRMNYYNSFVILPFLYIIYKQVRSVLPVFQTRFTDIVARLHRHAEWLERLIACDGTFPLFGRSIVYRTAIFHALSFCAVHVGLPASLQWGQVRRALLRVHDRVWVGRYGDAQFDAAGFLQLGFMGSQPCAADSYSNNGSCYFTGLSFSVLSLDKSHAFWSSPDVPFTQECGWGEDCVGNTGLKKDQVL